MVAMVESVRVGTILAHDQKEYSRWRSGRSAQRGQSARRGLNGDALEREVGRIALLFPGNVIHGQVAA